MAPSFIVAKDGSGGFSSIVQAISAASAGQVILIKDGTYAEDSNGSGYFTISKDLTLKAYPGHTPILEPSGTTAKPTIYANANVVIDGLEVRGLKGITPSDTYSSNCVSAVGIRTEIKNCNLTAFAHCGIKVFGGAIVATDNTIHDGGDAVFDHAIYMGTGQAQYSHTIRGNTIYNISGYGVHLYHYEYNAMIDQNTIHDCVAAGMLITGENHVITNNNIYDNAQSTNAGGIHFYHYGMVNLTVTGNTLSNNPAYDLQADFSEGEGFVNCTISDNTGTKNF